jgi:hypothetical protein
MPPKKIRVIPRNAPTPAQAAAVSPPANSRTPQTIIERLRQRVAYLDARTLAEILDYDNVKRVYALDLPRYPLGKEGEGGLRWDPADVADYLERRMQRPDPRRAA